MNEGKWISYSSRSELELIRNNKNKIIIKIKLKIKNNNKHKNKKEIIKDSSDVASHKPYYHKLLLTSWQT